MRESEGSILRVFVLGTGRCGTRTFIEACSHLTNYTAGHETKVRRVGEERFSYPDQHVEADHRLSFFLGDMEVRFPDEYYVHLRRDREETAASWAARWDSTFRASMIRAFAHGIVMKTADWKDPLEVCRFYVDTVTRNVDRFMAGRRGETIWLDQAQAVFPGFLERVGAQGDLGAATAEWSVRHNARPTGEE